MCRSLPAYVPRFACGNRFQMTTQSSTKLCRVLNGTAHGRLLHSAAAHSISISMYWLRRSERRSVSQPHIAKVQPPPILFFTYPLFQRNRSPNICAGFHVRTYFTKPSHAFVGNIRTYVYYILRTYAVGFKFQNLRIHGSGNSVCIV